MTYAQELAKGCKRVKNIVIGPAGIPIQCGDKWNWYCSQCKAEAKGYAKGLKEEKSYLEFYRRRFIDVLTNKLKQESIEHIAFINSELKILKEAFGDLE